MGRTLRYAEVALATTSRRRSSIANDLAVWGRLAGGGDLGDVDLIYIPALSTLVLLNLGAFTVALGRRRRRGA